MWPPPLCTDSHFVLGNTQENITTIYKKDFVQKADEQQSNNNLRKNTIYRGSSLGPQIPEKNQYITTNKTKLLPWKDVQPPVVDQNKKNDFVNHHFGLGNYTDRKGVTTTNKYFHNQKDLSKDAKQNSEFYRNRMRAHSHNFQQAPKVSVASVYNKQFNEKQLQYTKSFKIPAQEIQNYVVLGNQVVPKQTTHNHQFQKRDYTRARIKKAPLEVVLGEAQNSYQTTNKQYYDKKPIKKNSLPAETLNELKGTHFNLGNMKLPYSTQANKLQIQRSVEMRHPAIQENRNLIAMSNKFFGTTTNNSQYPSRPYSKITMQKKTENNNHFQFGYQGNSYQSEFKSKYVTNDKKDVKLYEFGDDSVKLGIDKNSFATVHRSFHNSKDIKQALPTRDASLDPLANHFSIGNADEKKVTIYQDEYRKDHESKNQIFHKTNL